MKRIDTIINILLMSKSPITVDSIASKLEVSNKTIRNDLKKVEEYLKNEGLQLHKKPGVGVFIEGPKDKKLKLLSDTGINVQTIEPYTPEDRKNYILKRLFMSEKNITIKELSYELYVSRVTIHKDLDDVEKWISKFNLQLLRKPNRGLEIIGEEKDWRKAVSSLIAYNKGSMQLKEMLYEYYGGRIDYKTLTKLKELVNLDYNKLENIVSDAEKALKFRFSDEAFIGMIIHIAIAIKRLKGNKYIHLSEEIKEGLKQKEEYHIAEHIAQSVQENFKVKLPDSEISYILLHIIGAKMLQNKVDLASMKLTEDDENDNEVSVMMAKEIVAIAERVLGLDFSGDNQLLNGLILHLRPTINRLKYGLTLRNPIMEQIKANYPEIYGVSWMTSTVFERYLGVKIPEEEIGYLTLHLGAAIERQNKPLKALVVCTSGIGTSQLLAEKLERHFRQIDIKAIISIAMINEKLLNDVDVVISTVPISVDKPVLNISPLMTQKDIKLISEFLNYSKVNLGGTALSFITEDFVILGAPYKTKDEVLESVGSLLVDRGYVKQEYIPSLKDRESCGTTVVGNGVAIPHGLSTYVLKSQIVVCLLNKSIDWDGAKVDIVFMISVSSGDAKGFIGRLKNLYKVIDDEDFLKSLRKAKSEQQVAEVVNKVLREQS